jgi:hypothetical protein
MGRCPVTLEEEAQAVFEAEADKSWWETVTAMEAAGLLERGDH